MIDKRKKLAMKFLKGTVQREASAAEMSFIQKAFIKEGVAEIFRKMLAIRILILNSQIHLAG
jgi:hypothetical protein